MGMREHFGLERFELVGDPIEEWKVRVHHPVGEQVVDEVRAAMGQPIVARDASPDLVERRDVLLVDGDEVSLAEERVDLVDVELAALRIGALERVVHDEQVVAVLFELRALIEVRTVLDRERVEIEARLEELETLRVLVLEIDPAEATCLRRVDVLVAFACVCLRLLRDRQHAVHAGLLRGEAQTSLVDYYLVLQPAGGRRFRASRRLVALSDDLV